MFVEIILRDFSESSESACKISSGNLNRTETSDSSESTFVQTRIWARERFTWINSGSINEINVVLTVKMNLKQLSRELIVIIRFW